MVPDRLTIFASDYPAPIVQSQTAAIQYLQTGRILLFLSLYPTFCQPLLSGKCIQRALTFRICSPAHIHHMNESIRMTQIIQEFIPQSASLVCSWNKTRDIQKFNGNGSSSFVAASVIWFALVRNVKSLTCAFYLKVTNSALRVNRGETRNGGLGTSIAPRQCAIFDGSGMESATYGKFPSVQLLAIEPCPEPGFRISRRICLPTLELASVKLFSVVDFPLDGC